MSYSVQNVSNTARYTYTVQKNVPIPAKHTIRKRESKFPWKIMQPGDSFFAAGYVPRQGLGKGKVLSAVTGRQYHPGSSWTIKAVIENGRKGVRVWRRA